MPYKNMVRGIQGQSRSRGKSTRIFVVLLKRKTNEDNFKRLKTRRLEKQHIATIFVMYGFCGGYQRKNATTKGAFQQSVRSRHYLIASKAI